MRKLLALLVLLALSLFGAEEIYYEDDISVQEAYEMVQKGAILIDVRTPGEYIYAGHPLGAVSIPIFDYSYKPKALQLRSNLAKKEKKRALDAHKVYDITPIENKQFAEDVAKLLKLMGNHPIVLICRTGARSQYAANLLAKKGFAEVYNVEGGFLAWKKAKLPYGGE